MKMWFGNCIGSIYILDNITNASAAFSVRVLSRDFISSPLIKLRRSSDNAVVDVYAYQGIVISGNSTVSAGGNLTTWAGADDLFVDTWYDQSGNGNNISQSNTSQQVSFIIDESHLNDLPTLSGLGTGNLVGTSLIGSPTSATIFVVLANISPGTDNPFFTISNNLGLPWLMDHMITDGAGGFNQYRLAERQSDNSALLDSNGVGNSLGDNIFAQFTTILKNTSTLEAIEFQNGNEIYDDSSVGAWSNSLVLTPKLELFSRAFTSQFFLGKIPEFIIYNRALSTSNYELVISNQTSFFVI